MPKQNQNKSRKQRLFFTGFTMGLADLVPGVSGGTVALLLGIYDELLFSIKVVSGQAVRYLLQGKLKRSIVTVPWGFLLPLFAGIVVAIFGLANIVEYALDEHASLVWALFFGFVVGSSFVVSKQVVRWNLVRSVLVFLGALLTYWIVGLAQLNTSSSLIMIFVTGMIAFCAMILPGISGSLIMVILGQYERVIGAVSDRTVSILLALGFGGAVGLSIFSRILSWLLHVYHGATIAFLVGVMLGSLRKLWPWHTSNEDGSIILYVPDASWQTAGLVCCIVIGAGAVLLLEYLGATKEKDDIDSPQFTRDIKSIRNS